MMSIANTNMPRSERIIREILERLAKGEYAQGWFFSIGRAERVLTLDALSRGILLANGHVYLSDTQIQHATRDSKRAAGIMVPEDELATFPQRLSQMELWYDIGHRNYVYLDRSNRSKYIVDTSRLIKLRGKKTRRALVITMQKMRNVNLFGTDRKYMKVRD